MQSAVFNVQSINYGSIIERGIVAVNNIAPGQIIFEEDPLVFCQHSWNRQYGYLACDHCLKPLETTEQNVRRLLQNPNFSLPFQECCPMQNNLESVAPCPECEIPYCSAKCRELAFNQYHATLCLKDKRNDPNHPLNQLEKAWMECHYPPEAHSIMILARMVAMVRQSSNKSELIQKFASFRQSTVDESTHFTHKLMGEKFRDQIEQVRLLFSNALFDESIGSWFSYEGFRMLLSLLGRNALGVATSPLSVWSKNLQQIEMDADQRSLVDNITDEIYSSIDDVVGQFIDCEGSALYSLHSLLNHRCNPNSEVKFDGLSFRLNIVAVEPIKAGEEVTVSYLSECDQERSRHSRRKWLRENYLFDCECDKCLSQIDQEDVTSEEEADGDDDDEEMDS